MPKTPAVRDDELVVLREKTQKILECSQDLIHDFESLRKQIVNIRGGQRSSFACAISAGGVQSHFRPLSLLFFLFERVYPSCFRTVVMR